MQKKKKKKLLIEIEIVKFPNYMYFLQTKTFID
jgi:hypothetical protein